MNDLELYVKDEEGNFHRLKKAKLATDAELVTSKLGTEHFEIDGQVFPWMTCSPDSLNLPRVERWRGYNVLVIGVLVQGEAIFGYDPSTFNNKVR